MQADLPDIPDTLDGFRILHLSDLHCRTAWDPAYDVLISRLSSDRPDLILFGGDFVENKRDARPALPIVRKLFSQLASRLGIFAILGNHDADWVAPVLAGPGLTFISHRQLQVQDRNATIELIGLPGVDRRDLDVHWVNSLPSKRPGIPRIVLCHFPDLLAKVRQLNPDLFLAGHTHGGQITLPGGLPILRHSTFPRRLCTGIHRTHDTVLVTNRGFGFSSILKLRVFCPAEVVEIILRRN